MPKCIFKHLSERVSPVEVSHLSWNSKFDLLAIATVNGALILQRIFWKKAWEYPCPDGKLSIRAICWSPWGDSLCICYADGEVRFLEIENGRLIHKWQLETDLAVRTVKWFQSEKLDLSRQLVLRDLVPNFIPLVKESTNGSVQKSLRPTPDFSAIFLNEEHKSYCSLLFCASQSKILAYLNGYLHLFSIDFSADLLDFEISSNFQTIWLLKKDEKDSPPDTSIDCLTVDLTAFSARLAEFAEFGRRLGKLIYCAENVSAIMKSVKESWDDILSEVGRKFAKFAREKFLLDPEATVADDLVTALAFGSVSAELQLFLSMDLNEKSLKKLAQSMDNTYNDLKRLISSNLSTSLSILHYHLVELNRFNKTKLFDQDCLKEAIIRCQATVLKGREILNVLSANLREFELFFSFLGKLTSSLNGEENVPPHQRISGSASSSSTFQSQFANLSVRDIGDVLNFIEETFSKPYCDDSASLFTLEKVGQYLQNKDLSVKFDQQTMIDSDPSWNRSSSLVQEIGFLNTSLETLIRRVSTAFVSNFIPSKHVVENLHNFSPSDSSNQIQSMIKKSSDHQSIFVYLTFEPDYIKVFGFVKPKKKFKEVGRLDCCDKFVVKNLLNYDRKSICVLLENCQNSESIRYKLALIDEALFQHRQGETFDLKEQEFIRIQSVTGGPYETLDLCSSRKVGCFLHGCKTRLKLIEMEPEEESTMNDSTTSL